MAFVQNETHYKLVPWSYTCHILCNCATNSNLSDAEWQ